MGIETYEAVNIGEIFNIEEMNKKNISCWVLYQTSEESGNSIRLMTPVAPHIILKKVLPKTLCYIMYEEGEYYKKESLVQQLEENRLNMEQMLLKEGFEISSPEKILAETNSALINPWKALKKEEVSEIIVDDYNGFCVFHPIEKKRYNFSGSGANVVLYEYKGRTVEVCYRPKRKQLCNTFLDKIFCKINLEETDFDYKNYFAKTLVNEQMVLNEVESLELYSILEENIEKYYFSGKEKRVSTKDSAERTELIDVCFFKDTSSQTELYYGSNKIKVKGYSTQKLFEWWIAGKLDKQINKAKMLGVFES